MFGSCSLNKAKLQSSQPEFVLLDKPIASSQWFGMKQLQHCDPWPCLSHNLGKWNKKKGKKRNKKYKKESSKCDCNWLVTMIQNWMPRNIENWQFMLATCIFQEPEHVEIEIIQGTLEEAVLQVCSTIDSCSLQTLPLLGIWWPLILKSKNPEQEKMEENAQE